MENSGDNISFEDVLGTENSGWELLDDTGAMGFAPPTSESAEESVKESAEGEEGTEEEGTDPVSFESSFDETSIEDTSEEPEVEESDSDNDNLFSYIGETLNERGIISLGEDDKLESEEDIYNKVEESINNGIESWKQGLGEESLRYIDFIEKGGNPQDYIQVNSIPDYSNTNLESDDAKKEVISAFYKEKGFSDSKIKTLIESSEDMEELQKDAEEAQSYFSEKKEREKEALLKAQAVEQEERLRQQEQFTTDVQDYIKNSEDIRNFPLKSKKQKDEIMSYIFDKNVNYKQADGSVVKVSGYMADKIKRSQDQSSKLEDIVFDALIMKYGSAPIEKNTITKRNKRFEELAKNHKSKSGASKLSSSGGKGNKPRTSSKTVSFDDWKEL